jgi:hypothetical protein
MENPIEESYSFLKKIDIMKDNNVKDKKLWTRIIMPIDNVHSVGQVTITSENAIQMKLTICIVL